MRFIGFGAEVSNVHKYAAIRAFFAKHFADVQLLHVDHFSKRASFAQLSTPQIAKLVNEKVKDRKPKLDGHPNVEIKPGKTAIDLSRDFNLYKAADLIKADPKSTNKTVETKDRSVLVDGAVVFKQVERFDPKGNFEGEYVHLKLP